MTTMNDYRQRAIAAAVLQAAYTAASAAYLTALAAGGDAGACDPACGIVSGLRERAGRADSDASRAFQLAIVGDGEPTAAMAPLDAPAEPDMAFEAVESPIIGMDVEDAFSDAMPAGDERTAPRYVTSD